jgi:hypothetical protein
MEYELIVTAPWGDHKRGDVITDDAAINDAMEDHSHCVVKRMARPAPSVTAQKVGE